MGQDWKDWRVRREKVLHSYGVQTWIERSAECCSRGRELSAQRCAGVSLGLRAVFVFVSEHLCACVCVDTLKADACFGHVVKTLRGWVCVCVTLCVFVCERAREIEKQEWHTGWWPPSWWQHLTDRVCCTEHTSSPRQSPFTHITPPPKHPLLPGYRRLMHSTSPQGPRGQTHMCVRVCVFLW